MRLRIGDFLVEKGLLRADQVGEILEYSERTGARFGDAAIELGLLDRERLVAVFGPNFRADYFHLDPRFFPKHTREAIGLGDILGLGALPLGLGQERGGIGELFRSRAVLNIGLVDPSDECALAELERRAGVAVRPFLVLPDSFVAVLHEIYGLSDAKIRAAEHLHPLLARMVGAEAPTAGGNAAKGGARAGA